MRLRVNRTDFREILMKNNGVIMGFVLVLAMPSLWAGPYHIKKGDLADNDKIDYVLRQQSGNCPTKYPVESIDCTYSSHSVTGLIAKYIEESFELADLSTENTFSLDVSLNADTQTKGYPFDNASCASLQTKIKTGSIIVINQRGCTL